MHDFDKPRIITHIENDDPVFVALYDLASHAVDVLQDLLKHLWEGNWYAKIEEPEQRALFKFVGIHGTLAWEASAAAKELALDGLPRAMNILMRSTFEYSVRLRYLHKHPDYARQQMDALPAAIQREVKSATKAFSPETVEKLADSYTEWERDHPDLAKAYKDEVKFAPMAREVMGEHYNTEWWKWYSLPSIIAHSKPLAISDTIQIDDENGIVTLFPNSRHLNVYFELGKIASIVTELVGFITIQYQVNARPYVELDEKLGKVLEQYGFAVKKHRIFPASAEPGTSPT